MATSCEKLTHWKRLWCWKGLGAGGEGDDRGWDGWMASLTWWTWIWVNSGSWWWTGRPGVLQLMGSQRVRHDWATEMNWNWTETELRIFTVFLPNGKCLLISWLQAPSVVILEPKKIKFVTIFNASPAICHEVMGLDAMILVFWMFLSQLSHSPLSLSSRGSLVPLHFLPEGCCHLLIWGYWYFYRQS